MRCDNCKFWEWNKYQTNDEFYDPDPDVQAGRCKRFPPSYIGDDEYDLDGDQTFKWVNPQTDGNDWCGEFVATPNAKVSGAGTASAGLPG